MLTGTNKDYIDSRIPHLSSLLVNDPAKLVHDCDIVVINTKEPEFHKLVDGIDGKLIIDFVRLDEALLTRSNYIGINW